MKTKLKLFQARMFCAVALRIGSSFSLAVAAEDPAGHPNVGWTKQGMDGLEILVDRGTGAVWKYKAIYRLGDEQVGQWSDVVSIPVAG